MTKPALYTAVVLVAGVLIYLGSVLIIGGQVESAISSIEADMIQSDELIVHRFEYESGFGEGHSFYTPAKYEGFYMLCYNILQEVYFDQENIEMLLKQSESILLSPCRNE